MLITNMIWKHLSHMIPLIMITTWFTCEYYIKVQSINLLKQSQVFGYTLYLYDVQKLASACYSSLSNQKPWSYLYCRQINEKCFRKYGNQKTIEILSSESKNLKDKIIHLFKVTRISWSLYTALICVAALMNRFRHSYFDIFADISFLPIHLCT